jgi:hypothetical protein
MLIAPFTRFQPIQMEILLLIPEILPNYHITANLDGFFPVRIPPGGREVKFAGGFPFN